MKDIASLVFNPPQRDRRVTPIGLVLRSTSLDEWPNLLNVIKGDMRLVGPRPDEPELVEQYLPLYHLRHWVKPGMTGLAQVNGRSNLTYHQMMTYDLDYVRNHSWRRDLAILGRTLARGTEEGRSALAAGGVAAVDLSWAVGAPSTVVRSCLA